ncbi:retinal homeobox protein Rx-like [Petaurus breviceps papuanus]|uniref:retinal homeobox protein Rx-like n=1 Tax=Petaurus breviceps papuanus TaxID=3040969 RepID=UPI0036DE9442
MGRGRRKVSDCTLPYTHTKFQVPEGLGPGYSPLASGSKGQVGPSHKSLNSQGGGGHWGLILAKAVQEEEQREGPQDPGSLQPLSPELWGGNTHLPPRRNRVAFTKPQLKTLEWVFEQSPYPDQGTRRHLAGLLLQPEARVQVWFKNRRAKLRRRRRLQQPEEQRSKALNGAEVASCQGPEFLPAASRTRPQTPISESHRLCQRPESQVQDWQGSLGSSWNIGLGLGWGVPWACQALAWTVTPRWGTIPSHWLCSPPAQSWPSPPASYSPLYRLTTSLRPTNLTNHPINRYLLYPPFMPRSVLSDMMG